MLVLRLFSASLLQCLSAAPGPHSAELAHHHHHHPGPHSAEVPTSAERPAGPGSAEGPGPHPPQHQVESEPVTPKPVIIVRAGVGYEFYDGHYHRVTSKTTPLSTPSAPLPDQTGHNETGVGNNETSSARTFLTFGGLYGGSTDTRDYEAYLNYLLGVAGQATHAPSQMNNQKFDTTTHAPTHHTRRHQQKHSTTHAPPAQQTSSSSGNVAWTNRDVNYYLHEQHNLVLATHADDCYFVDLTAEQKTRIGAGLRTDALKSDLSNLMSHTSALCGSRNAFSSGSHYSSAFGFSSHYVSSHYESRYHYRCHNTNLEAMRNHYQDRLADFHCLRAKNVYRMESLAHSAVHSSSSSAVHNG